MQRFFCAWVRLHDFQTSFKFRIACLVIVRHQKKAQEDPDSLVSKLNLPNWFDKQYDPKRDGRSRAGSEGDDRGENTYDSDDDAEAAISGDSVDDNGSLNEPRPLGDDDAYSDEEGPEQEAEEVCCGRGLLVLMVSSRLG